MSSSLCDADALFTKHYIWLVNSALFFECDWIVAVGGGDLLIDEKGEKICENGENILWKFRDARRL